MPYLKEQICYVNTVTLQWILLINPLKLTIFNQPVKMEQDDMDNLACACSGCNSFKHSKITGKDPFDNSIAPLFHPRQMLWEKHFAWSTDYLEIIGLTNIGRATVKTLQMNRIGLVNIRRLLLLDGSHPPN